MCKITFHVYECSCMVWYVLCTPGSYNKLLCTLTCVLTHAGVYNYYLPTAQLTLSGARLYSSQSGLLQVTDAFLQNLLLLCNHICKIYILIIDRTSFSFEVLSSQSSVERPTQMTTSQPCKMFSNWASVFLVFIVLVGHTYCSVFP